MLAGKKKQSGENYNVSKGARQSCSTELGLLFKLGASSNPMLYLLL